LRMCRNRFNFFNMVTKESALEHTVVLQEQRLLVLRRQLVREEHHVSSRLKPLERDNLAVLADAERRVVINEFTQHWTE
jgi:hypothetical protein